MDKKTKIRYAILGLWGAILLMCIALYVLDMIRGDGDGIIYKWNLNPLYTVVIATLFLWPLSMVFSEKERLSNSALMVFTFLLMLAGIEWGLNILEQKNEASRTLIENKKKTPIFTRFDEVYFKNYVPNAQFVTHLGEMDGSQSIPNTINADGIRGSEIPKSKTKQRLIFLGDSYLQSDEIPYEQTIGQLVQSQHQDSILVLQHGSPSWSPLLEWNWLLKKGLGLEPDHVLLFVFYNDFFEGKIVGDQGYTSFCVFDENGRPESFSFAGENAKVKYTSVWRDFQYRLGGYKLLQLIGRAIRGEVSGKVKTTFKSLLEMEKDSFLLHKPEIKKNYYDARKWGLIALMRDTATWDVELKERMDLSLGYIIKMKEDVEDAGANFSLVLIAHPWQFEDENLYTRSFYKVGSFIFPRSGVESRLAQFCEKEKIPYLSLYDAFAAAKKSNSTQKLFYDYDGHWTPYGHRIAAEAVGDWMKNHKGE